MRLVRLSGATLTGAVLLAASTGCESAAQKKAEHAFDKAADQSTCRAEADPMAKPWPDGFPARWPFPPKTTVFSVEDRGDDGVIATGISSAPFQAVLDQMNGPVVDAGFTTESGETEEHDAEAEWEGNGYRGRWAIRESANCPGETVVQVVSTNR